MISASRFLDSYSGYRALRAGLITDTYLEAMVRARHSPLLFTDVDRLWLQVRIVLALSETEFVLRADKGSFGALGVLFDLQSLLIASC